MIFTNQTIKRVVPFHWKGYWYHVFVFIIQQCKFSFIVRQFNLRGRRFTFTQLVLRFNVTVKTNLVNFSACQYWEVTVKVGVNFNFAGSLIFIKVNVKVWAETKITSVNLNFWPKTLKCLLTEHIQAKTWSLIVIF